MTTAWRTAKSNCILRSRCMHDVQRLCLWMRIPKGALPRGSWLSAAKTEGGTWLPFEGKLPPRRVVRRVVSLREVWACGRFGYCALSSFPLRLCELFEGPSCKESPSKALCGLSRCGVGSPTARALPWTREGPLGPFETRFFPFFMRCSGACRRCRRRQCPCPGPPGRRSQTRPGPTASRRRPRPLPYTTGPPERP